MPDHRQPGQTTQGAGKQQPITRLAKREPGRNGAIQIIRAGYKRKQRVIEYVAAGKSDHGKGTVTLGDQGQLTAHQPDETCKNEKLRIAAAHAVGDNPRTGASRTIIKLATVLASPMRNVLSAVSRPAFQHALNHTEKNTAITVVQRQVWPSH